MKNLSTSVSSTRCLWSKMPPSSRKGWVWTWDRWIPIWNFVHSLPGHWLDAWQFQADLTSKGAFCSDLREHRQSWRRPGCPNAGEKRRRCLPSLWKKIQQCWKCLVLTSRCHHQVMVCGERVGWREEARRVIIYTTDQVPVTAKPTSCWFCDFLSNFTFCLSRASTARATGSSAVWLCRTMVGATSTPPASMTGALCRWSSILEQTNLSKRFA